MHFEKDIYYSNPCSIPQKHWGGCGDRWLTKDDTRQHHIFGNFAVRQAYGTDRSVREYRNVGWSQTAPWRPSDNRCAIDLSHGGQKFLFGPDGTLLDTLEYESGTEAFASAAAFDKWMDDVAVPTIQSMLAKIE